MGQVYNLRTQEQNSTVVVYEQMFYLDISVHSNASNIMSKMYRKKEGI